MEKMEEYTQLYFQNETEVNMQLINTFYEVYMKKLQDKEIEIAEIKEGIDVDIANIEESTGEKVSTADINHLCAALSRILNEKTGKLRVVHVKLFRFPSPVPFHHLRHSFVGKIFSLVGIVAKTESSRPVAQSLVFSCLKCKSKIDVFMGPGGIYKKPNTCQSPCISKSLILQKDSSNNVFFDVQRIKLHEICLEQGEADEKRKAGTIECILTRDLINKLLPGDAIHILGTGAAEETAPGQFALVLEANNYIFLKQRDTFTSAPFCILNEDSIKRMAENEDILKVLSHSLFGDIVGHEMVKEGIILSLLGASCREGTCSRREIHTLIVGDPGMGKSKLMSIASSILPRSNYTCGTTSTSGGLGVSIYSRPGGEYSLEAGALVLSDQGHCFIDELDKMDSVQILFEAMERAQLSIAKAGMICTMPCRASVIAAANPVLGKYSSNRSLCDNLIFTEAFLSRFDIVFLMIDSEETRAEVAQHILSLQANEYDDDNRVSSSVARKYIQYARDHIHPVLSSSAKTLLKEFYSSIKSKGHHNNRVTIQNPSPRIISAISRVCEARAKANLRLIATKRDMEYAIHLCTIPYEQKRSLPSGSPQKQLHLSLLSLPGPVTREDIYKAAALIGIQEDKAEIMIQRLNRDGFLLMRGPGVYTVKE